MTFGARFEAVESLVGAALGWTVVGSLVAAPIDGLVVFTFGCEGSRESR